MIQGTNSAELVTLNYDQATILEQAFREIDAGSNLRLEINGWRVERVAESLPLFLKLNQDRNVPRGLELRLLLFKFAFKGAFCAPTLWGICNRALLKGMHITGWLEKNTYILLCTKPLVSG